MDHYDKDRRYMAARDVCGIVSSSGQNIDTNLQQEICNAFVKHLDDPSIEVQGNAAKSLIDVLCTLNDKHLCT